MRTQHYFPRVYYMNVLYGQIQSSLPFLPLVIFFKSCFGNVLPVFYDECIRNIEVFKTPAR